MSAKAPSRQTCTEHCTSCGQHFHGMGAFDAHLERINEGFNRWNAPSYQLKHLDGSEVDRLELWTGGGICKLSKPTQEPVTIWRVALSDTERDRLIALKNRGEKADSGGGPSRRGPQEAVVDVGVLPLDLGP